MVRIVLTSDNHLNAYYAKMAPHVLRERRKRIRDAWRTVVNHALDRECHLFLQAGDMFDMPDPRTTELVAVAQDFRRLHDAGVKVFCIGGTHDVHRMSTTGVLALRIYHETGHAHVFTSAEDPAPVVHEIEGLRVAVGGLSVSHTFGRGEDPLEDVEYNADADFKILLMHYGVEGTIHPDADEPILTKDALSKAGVDLIGVGHVHQHKKMLLGHTTVVVPGSTERHTFGERGIQPGFYYIEVDQSGIRTLEHIPVVSQQMEETTIRTTELDDENPMASLQERIREASKDDQMLKVNLEGPLSPQKFHRLRLRDAFLLGSDLNFYFTLDTRRMHVSEAERLPPGEAGSATINQREEIARVAGELMAQAENEDERSLLAAALDRVLADYRAGG